jgi:hypothetical protein
MADDQITVELISAPWCKRCVTLKPEIEVACSIAGIPFVVVNFDEEEEDSEIKKAVTALPTIRMRLGPDKQWVYWTTSQLNEWKKAVTAKTATQSTDF